MKINKVLTYSLTLSISIFLNLSLKASKIFEEDQEARTDVQDVLHSNAAAPRITYSKDEMLRLREESPLSNIPLTDEKKAWIESLGVLKVNKDK